MAKRITLWLGYAAALLLGFGLGGVQSTPAEEPPPDISGPEILEHWQSLEKGKRTLYFEALYTYDSGGPVLEIQRMDASSGLAPPLVPNPLLNGWMWVVDEFGYTIWSQGYGPGPKPTALDPEGSGYRMRFRVPCYAGTDKVFLYESDPFLWVSEPIEHGCELDIAGCSSQSGPGCGGCPCEELVCPIDPYCCQVRWDSICVQECGEVYNCDPAIGCFPRDEAGCGTCACEDEVCAIDPYCCQVRWDSICVQECQDSQIGCGERPPG